MNIITVNHTTHSGTEALDVVMADEAIAEVEKVTNTANFALALREEEIEAKDKEIARLKADLREIIELGNPWSNSIAYMALDADNSPEGT